MTADALIVDDEEDICEFLREELAHLGFEAVTATTGEKAIELAAQVQIRLAVVDLKLSTAVTGLEVIREIRRRRPEAKIIAMTGYVDVGLRQETEKLGADAYFGKPDDLQPEIFARKIRVIFPQQG